MTDQPKQFPTEDEVFEKVAAAVAEQKAFEVEKVTIDITFHDDC